MFHFATQTSWNRGRRSRFGKLYYYYYFSFCCNSSFNSGSQSVFYEYAVCVCIEKRASVWIRFEFDSWFRFVWLCVRRESCFICIEKSYGTRTRTRALHHWFSIWIYMEFSCVRSFVRSASSMNHWRMWAESNGCVCIDILYVVCSFCSFRRHRLSFCFGDL